MANYWKYIRLYAVPLIAIIVTVCFVFRGEWESQRRAIGSAWHYILYSHEEQAMNYIATEALNASYIQAHQFYEVYTRHREDNQNMAELLRLRRLGDSLHVDSEMNQVQLMAYVKTLESTYQKHEQAYTTYNPANGEFDDTTQSKNNFDVSKFFDKSVPLPFQKTKLAELEGKINEQLITGTYCGPERWLWLYSVPYAPKIGETFQIVAIGYDFIKEWKCEATITHLPSGNQEPIYFKHHGNFVIAYWIPSKAGKYQYTLSIKDSPILHGSAIEWQIQVP